MTLGFYLFALVGIGGTVFWVLGALYGALRRPAVYFPFSLGLKMGIGAIVGAAAFGFGGIALATWLMNMEFSKRADYRAISCIAAGLVISVAASVMTAFAGYGLAQALWR